jgi:ArsR family transcriptional regulator
MGSISPSGIIGSVSAAEIVAEAMTVRQVVSLSEDFAAISDPNRLRLLDFLMAAEGGPLCVSDLAALNRTDISSTSHHLRKAKRAGLVKSFRHDKYAMYRLTPEGEQLMTLVRRALALKP